MKVEKSIVILTSFFDANYLISNGHMFYKPNSNKDLVYKIKFLNDKNNNPVNYTVDSMALVSPPIEKLQNINNMRRIDCLCPTYDMLHDYKSDHDWTTYTKRYVKLLKERKPRIKEWMTSLSPNHIYILCCWENTSRGSNCHRKIYYDALYQSDKAREVILPIYRSGSCSNEDDEIINDIGSSSVTSISAPVDWNNVKDYPLQYNIGVDLAVPNQDVSVINVHSIAGKE